MFWRFAPILRFGRQARTPKGKLDEARDEIASIALHTKSPELKSRCEDLLAELDQQVERDLSAEPFFDDMPAAVLIGGYFYHWYGRPAYLGPERKLVGAES
jgi:hypothetical protein